MGQQASSVHRLKVTLKGVKPPVWRRVEVSSAITLSELSDLLEAGMGWFGGHLHAFEADGVMYQTPDDEGFAFRPVEDERTSRLGDVLAAEKSKMRWDYDFGDGWEHEIVVEAVQPADAGVIYPVCVAGKRACPPEDCGGPWGYGDLLVALDDPNHEAHEEMLEWIGPGFDPSTFDVSEATEAMRSPHPKFAW